MKKIIGLLLVVVMVVGVAVFPVSAATTEPETSGRYHTTVDPETGLTKQIPITYWNYLQGMLHGVIDDGGGTAYVTADATGYQSNYKISLTVTLQVRNSSGNWTNVKNWSGSNKYSCVVSGSYTVPSTAYYRTKTVFTIYNTSGTKVESDTLYSGSTLVWV